MTKAEKDPPEFRYQCPRCKWSLLVQAEPIRGLIQPGRGLVAEHLRTHDKVVRKPASDAPVKRKRGRPKGSKNKPKPLSV